MLEKEKEVWTDIIDTFRDMPFLWDKTNSNYLNRDMRQEGFNILLDKYKVFDKSATLDVFKKKLENMRTTYNRELKKIKNSKITGSGLDDIYIPSLWYFDLMGFLTENTQPSRDGKDTLENSTQETPQVPVELSNENALDQEASGTNAATQEEIPSTSKMTNTKRQRKSLDKAKEEVLKKANKLLDDTEQEWEIIGKSLGLQLSTVDPQQSAIANKLISDVIFYAKLGKLTENASIILNPAVQTPYHYQYSSSSPSSRHSVASVSTPRVSQYSASYSAPPSISMGPISLQYLASGSTPTTNQTASFYPVDRTPTVVHPTTFDQPPPEDTDIISQYLVFK
ncbi:hypothetical protein PPYR_00043 [Photinus pyralis]|uniref:MADF domain-containing protein n=1 Tax=Photinus pyralis TaxID=7054 RepID=A0A5N4B0J6_PHOPY|nr:uncharacterized protein LOC116175606 isoform X1 [Photinus pyralis]KAB0803073.1 hypothetical protein PPYR_00043 [Photinus pyralis]